MHAHRVHTRTVRPLYRRANSLKPMIIPRNFQYLVLNEATKNRTKLNRTNEGKKIELNLRICSVVVFTADRSFID